MSDQANPAAAGMSPGQPSVTGRAPDGGGPGPDETRAAPDETRAAPDETAPTRGETAPAADETGPAADETGPASDPVELLRVRAGLRPAPPPLEVDTFTLVLVGTGLWAVAFLALLPVRQEHRLWLEICVVGFGLGLIGLFLTRNRRVRRGRPR